MYTYIRSGSGRVHISDHSLSYANLRKRKVIFLYMRIQICWGDRSGGWNGLPGFSLQWIFDAAISRLAGKRSSKPWTEILTCHQLLPTLSSKRLSISVRSRMMWTYWWTFYRGNVCSSCLHIDYLPHQASFWVYVSLFMGVYRLLYLEVSSVSDICTDRSPPPCPLLTGFPLCPRRKWEQIAPIRVPSRNARDVWRRAGRTCETFTTSVLKMAKGGLSGFGGGPNYVYWWLS